MPEARFSLVSRHLPPGLVGHVRSTLARWSPVESSPQTVSLEALSFRFFTDDAALAELREELRGPCLALGVDCALLTGELAIRGPRLIVSDVDSTFIEGEVIEMLAEEAGSLDMVAEVTARAMEGELDFAESLARRVATLKGLSEQALTRIGEGVRPVLGAEILVRAAHAHGAAVGLVSGGFHEVVGVVVERLGIDFALANRLGVASGALTGETVGPVVTRDAKAQALRRWADEMGLMPAQAAAMGDGANDLGMMEIAGVSVAVCAKPIVREFADVIVSEHRLDGLTSLFGWDAI